VTTVLLASGRAPNVESLRLDELGIDHDRFGIRVDDRLRTSVSGIWAAGDVTGRYQFTPIAQYQARIAIDDMFGADPLPADYSALPTAIFTEPELAGVGMTEEEARDEGLDFGIAVHGIEHVQRSSYKDQKRGLYKLLYERSSRRLIGLHVVAPNGSEIVQGLALALRFETTVDDLARMHHVFPTFGEGVKAAAEQALPQPIEMATICN
jgi:mercuric reductase